MGLGMWMTSCSEAMGWGFWVIFEKKTELRPESRRGQLGLRGAPRVVWSDGTVSIVKIMSVSPRVENLKVKKVIKVSYLNKESRQCFAYFEIPMHMHVLQIRTFYASVYSYILYIRIWLCYTLKTIFVIKTRTDKRMFSSFVNNFVD